MERFRNLCLAYVSNVASLNQFLDGFTRAYAQLVTELSGRDLETLGQIGLSVAEFTKGDISESALKADIRRYSDLGGKVISGFHQVMAGVSVSASASATVELQAEFA